MILLHNIGQRCSSNYNTLDEIVACNDPLSFDGIYRNVYDNRNALVGKDITLFVMGDYVGMDNKFDIGQKLENFCSWDEIQELSKILNARLGFHSWTHRDLTKLSDEEVIKEITPPEWFPVKTFAYPYGAVDTRVANIVRDSGLYEDAYSVNQGDGSRFQKARWYLNW